MLQRLTQNNFNINIRNEKPVERQDTNSNNTEGYQSFGDELYFYHPDHLGSATFLTDHEGLPYQFYLNLPFGESMSEQRSYTGSFDNRWKFTGKELDEETGLYYFGARFYNPSTSIWLSVDPLVEKTMDAYGYCYQNPLRFIDFDGREPTPYEAALMAAHIYGDSKHELVGGWQQSYIYQFNENNNKSGLKAAMYERIKEDGTREYAFVFAGTELHDKTDTIEDLLQIVGQSVQYMENLKLVENLNNYVSGNELTFVGHSLGGGLATFASLITGRNALTFNPARLSELTYQKNKKKFSKKKGKITNYIHESDPLDKIQNKPASRVLLKDIGTNININGGFFSNIFTGHLMNTVIDRMQKNKQATQHGGNKDDRVHRSPRYQ